LISDGSNPTLHPRVCLAHYASSFASGYDPTRRCHKKEFLLKFARDRHRYLQWGFCGYNEILAPRKGINKFFHFTSLAKADDKWVVSPNNDVIYSMTIVDASKGFTTNSTQLNNSTNQLQEDR
jgi:hypothetical protein